jgi:CRP/FNR family cyclic AMP-dependent transcriptional regulator
MRICECEKAGMTEIRSASFLAHAGLGRRIIELKPGETFFSQGDPADSVFYLQRGRAKLTVVSHKRQRGHHHASLRGDFVGEESLAAVPGLRLATATAVNNVHGAQD